jgi:geranylgeranyl diphosphate synthase type II
MYIQLDLIKLVNIAILNLDYNQKAEKLNDPVKYILSIGGKRLRPVLALMACNLFTDSIDEAIIPATGLEVFHNFTLVHDDIMDHAPVRRSLPTVHNKWNLNQAVLSGDVMAFIANECFLQTPPHCLLKVFKVFNKAAIEVCVGQQLDIDFEKLAVVTRQEYLDMIEMKTAALLAASAKIGSIIGGADDKDSDLIYEYGKNLGLAFQIQDDLLDIYGDIKIFGKIPGGDIISNKKTIMLVKALELASAEQSRQLHELFSMKEFDPEDKVNKVTEIYNQLNIRHVSEIIANEYINTAFSLLGKISVPNERKTELVNIANSLIGRDY